MKLQLRLAWIGVAFAVLFTTLFTRLWFVQVAAGADYAEAAEDLQLNDQPTLPARGLIVDRAGRILASSVSVPAVVVDRKLIPAEDEPAVIQELAGLLGLDVTDLSQRFEDAGSGNRFVLGEVEDQDVRFILTHQERFVGIDIEFVPRRLYPQGSFMAHVLGHIGRVAEEDLEADPDLLRNGVVGKAGVERMYNDHLKGEPGRVFFEVTPSGAVPGGSQSWEIPAEEGDTVVLTLDAEVQRVAEQALADGITMSREDIDESVAERGAVVVMDATDGAVVAMASYPTFDPSAFVLGISQFEYQALLDTFAFNNLAIQGLYAPGSTFKGVTYATAVQEDLYPARAHERSPDGSLECTGRLEANNLGENSQQVFRDPGHGIVDLHTALGASCNIYFWEVALQIWNQHKNTGDENILQQWARRLGYDEPTGIDLPFEAAGQIPDRQLFEEWAESAPFRLDPSRIDPGPIWVGGDVMNTAIGQGEVLVTPLQMAVAYAAMANGGTVWEPRVVDRVEAADGSVVLDVQPSAKRRLEFTAEFDAIFLEDLGRTTNAPYGTATLAFSAMDARSRVGGKTGTATAPNKFDTAWFVGVAPLDSPRWVVAVVVEEGGGGGRVAAPIARQIYQHLLGETVDSIRAGF